MPFLKVLLWPFATLYNLVTRLRNYLYDIGHTPSFQFGTVVISVGNLNVGGSGKTPMIEYLARLLQDRYKLAILSRGYGRKTKGIRVANDKDDANTLGDEPYQYFRKYGHNITVCVGEERTLAIPTILNEKPDTQIVLLDDAFQHRSVVPQFSILLTEFAKPFYLDYLLPFGRLRESRSGAKRADVIIVTKCKTELASEEMVNKIVQYAGNKPVFFTGSKYKETAPFMPGNTLGKRVVLVSGIANSDALQEFVSNNYEMIKHFKYKDHHIYSPNGVNEIQSYVTSNQADSVLTTEKDMVKLIAPHLTSEMDKKSWFYLPIETVFINRGSEFDSLVIQEVEKNLKSLGQ